MNSKIDSFKTFLESMDVNEMRLNKYMNDLDGNLFKYTHKKIILPDYNKIKKMTGAKEQELDGSDDEGLVSALIVNKKHILTYDEFEGLIYSNYQLKDLLKGNINN